MHQEHLIEETKLRSPLTLVFGLAVSIAVCFLAAGAGSLATTSSVDGWYATINKPTWNPPNWIFGPVWSSLFLMMGIAVWLVWKRSGIKQAKLALGWFAFHLILNVLWSVLFFVPYLLWVSFATFLNFTVWRLN